MKHIKIFEEFTHDKTPSFIPMPITQNELNQIYTITNADVINIDGTDDNYLLYQKIDKLEDGFWLVNNKIQFSSLQEMSRYCIENSNKAVELFRQLFNKIKLYHSSDNSKLYSIDGNVSMHHDINKNIIFITLGIWNQFENKFGMIYTGIEYLLNDFMSNKYSKKMIVRPRNTADLIKKGSM